MEPLPLTRGAGGSKGLPDPWEKLAKDYRTAPSAPDLLLNNSVFDDQDLSTQLDMLQPMLGQLAAAEQPSASDDDDEDFELEDEGAQPFLPSWVTPVSEDQRVRMRVDSGRAAIEDNDCTWQNAAEHVCHSLTHSLTHSLICDLVTDSLGQLLRLTDPWTHHSMSMANSRDCMDNTMPNTTMPKY